MNLSKLFKMQGKVEQSEKIKKQVEKYCRKNPFYHYSLGQSAFGQAKFGLAIQHFKRAIRRNSREPEFYARLAAAYYKQGNNNAAEKYLKKAGKLAKSFQQRILYNRKLNYLYSHPNLKR
jgi:Flp pilus assembly protein TadD